MQQDFLHSLHTSSQCSLCFTSFSFCQPCFLNSWQICPPCFYSLWLICILPEQLHLKLAEYIYSTNMDGQNHPRLPEKFTRYSPVHIYNFLSTACHWVVLELNAAVGCSSAELHWVWWYYTIWRPESLSAELHLNFPMPLLQLIKAVSNQSPVILQASCSSWFPVYCLFLCPNC